MFKHVPCVESPRNAQRERKPKDFVIPGLLRGVVGLIAGGGGVGKSFYALEVAMSVAAGKDLFGLLGQAPKRGRVLFLSYEDPEEELQDRWKALIDKLEKRGALTSEIASRIDENLVVQCLVGRMRAGRIIDGPDHNVVLAQEWADVVEAQKGQATAPDLIFIDTLAKCTSGYDETSARHMGPFIKALEFSARELNASVLCCHHVTKSSLQPDATLEAALRGHSCLFDEPRFVMLLHRLTPKEMQSFKLSAAEVDAWVHRTFLKVSYGRKPDPVFLRRCAETGDLSPTTHAPKPGKNVERLNAHNGRTSKASRRTYAA